MSTTLNQPRRRTARRYASFALLAWLMIAGVWMSSAQTAAVPAADLVGGQHGELTVAFGDVIGIDFGSLTGTTSSFGDVIGIDFGSLTGGNLEDGADTTPSFGHVIGVDFVNLDASGERP